MPVINASRHTSPTGRLAIMIASNPNRKLPARFTLKVAQGQAGITGTPTHKVVPKRRQAPIAPPQATAIQGSMPPSVIADTDIISPSRNGSSRYWHSGHAAGPVFLPP